MGEGQGNLHHDEFQKMALPRDSPAAQNTSQTYARPLSVISWGNPHYYFTIRTAEAFTDCWSTVVPLFPVDEELGLFGCFENKGAR